MPRVLTVDDSRAIRSIVSKQVQDLGFEIDGAEDGEQGLTRLEECSYDLVLLDVTMPVLDGPGMLAKMRERGDKTPVLMLTSESKRSVVAGAMKMGIEDYILKPFKPEELRVKILKALKLQEGAVASAVVSPMTAQPTAAPVAAPAQMGGMGGMGGMGSMGADTPAAGKQFVDILVIDDMENVQKKLRTMIPAHLSMNACVSAQTALTMCRERVYRAVLIDVEIPDVNSVALMTQLRTIQPHAAFLGLYLRSNGDPEVEAKKNGFDGWLLKPFEAGAVEDFLLQFFDNQEIITADDNLLKVTPFSGREDRLERYFARLGSLMEKFLENMAAACFDEAILDLSGMPAKPDKTPRLMAAVQDKSKKMGIELRIVGTPETKTVLNMFADTCALPFYESVQAARAASH
ncbi:response regulator [Myxococcota bacterium]|nr:response regulator [Myxococcota bacterium]